MSALPFAKYQAAGNDFLLVEAAEVDAAGASELARRFCRRRRGAGADGLLVVGEQDGDHSVMVINADGGVAETSGNGLRCAARYLLDRGRCGTSFHLTTAAGRVEVHTDGSAIRVNMGPPRTVSHPVAIDVADRRLDGIAISMGNPHWVAEIDGDVAAFPLAEFGAAAQRSFERGVNVEVVQRIGTNRVAARVWERGVGETLACGSGACAIAAALASAGRVSSPLQVQMPGGDLELSWSGEMPADLWLSGPVEKVYEGRT